MKQSLSALSPAFLLASLVALLLAPILILTACKAEEASTAQTTSTSSPSATQPAIGSDFDYYLLNLSWSPEFCYSHPNATECAAHPAFVLHGLWPQNTSGSWPSNCSTESGPANPAQYSDIYPDQGLLRHEWQKHGTCSGLSADAFFQTARAAVREIAIPPTLSSLTKQISLPPDRIVALFTASNPSIPRESFVVSCGNNYLTAVEVCLDKKLHPIACPAVRSCRANTVRIPAP
jgi:ribonuclease T2